MQPFKKLLASIGVGAAKIDTQLESLEVCLGDTLKGQLVVTGGTVPQNIDDVYITVKAKYRKQGLDSAYFTNGTVCHYVVSEAFTIEANETKEIPFEITIPFYTPITEGLSLLWLQTDLEIHHAKDAEDEDFLIVQSIPVIDHTIASIEAIGFEKTEVVCEDGSLEGMLPFDTGFYQVFRFQPNTNAFNGKVNRLDVVFNALSATETEVSLEIYHHPGNLLESIKEELGLETVKIQLTIKEEQAPSLEQLLKESIEQAFSQK